MPEAHRLLFELALPQPIGLACGLVCGLQRGRHERVAVGVGRDSAVGSLGH
jgi:hypothetical protein